MIKPVPKNQDGKLYQDMPNKGSLVLVRRKGKIHSCYIVDNKLLHLTTDETVGQIEGMICIAKVIDIVKNINAAFLRIKGERKCFISLNDLNAGRNLTRPGQTFAQGDNVLVQISKEASKGKEASATTAIKLEGKNCIVTTGTKALLFSQKISDEKKKMLAKEFAERDFQCPENLRIVVRTEVQSAEAVIAEANNLCEQLNKYYELANYRSDYSVLKERTPNYLEYIKTIDEKSCAKILTEDKELYDNIQKYITEVRPELSDKLHLYEDCLVPLNVLYGLEGKFSEIVSDKVWLKSGGFLYIEPTQAMTVIDVNTGKYDKKTGDEDTYFNINLEAAEEIATQIFLRNLTGIIVVDFINMTKKENKDALLDALSSFLRKNANPGRVFGFTRLGLVEITRRKTDKSIYEQISV